MIEPATLLADDAALKLGPLSLWVHGYESTQFDNFYDANWLRVTAICSASGSRVEVSGSILMASDLETWCRDIEKLSATLGGEAILEPAEPNLRVALRAAGLGGVTVEIQITPDHLSQEHRVQFSIDQSYLPLLVSGIRAALRQWPVRGQK